MYVAEESPFCITHRIPQNIPFTPTLMCRFISTSGTTIFLELSNVYPTGFLCNVYFCPLSNTDDNLIPPSNTFASDQATVPLDIQPRQLIFDQTRTVR